MQQMTLTSQFHEVDPKRVEKLVDLLTIAQVGTSEEA